MIRIYPAAAVAAVGPPRREPEAQAAEAGRASEDVEVLYGTGVPGGARARRYDGEIELD